MAGHYLVLKSDFMKKKLLIICGILLAGQLAFSQEKEAEAIVQKSLDAYNALDIDAFMALFSEDIEPGNPPYPPYPNTHAVFAKLRAANSGIVCAA